MKNKVTVIGAGNVGASTALYIAERGLADVTLIDRPEMDGMPQGKALDMEEAAPLWHKGVRMTGSTNLADVAGSDVVVMTAGFPRKPGMSRTDLLKANADIIKPAAEAVKQYAPNAYVVVVTNPLDVMVWAFREFSGMPAHRVVGMAGVLDTARFKTFLGEALNVSVENISALVLGGHGDTMVPITRLTNVSGIPLSELLPAEQIDAIVTRTQNGGAEIVKHLKTGSAYYAPSAATVEMVESILKDKKKVLPCCALLEGEYGINGLFFGVPVKLGASGIEKVYEVQLNDTEKAAMAKSAAAVARKAGYTQVNVLSGGLKAWREANKPATKTP